MASSIYAKMYKWFVRASWYLPGWILGHPIETENKSKFIKNATVSKHGNVGNCVKHIMEIWSVDPCRETKRWTRKRCAASLWSRGTGQCFKWSVLVNVENDALVLHIWYIYIYMTLAREPKQCFGESLRRNHKEEPYGQESWRRIH